MSREDSVGQEEDFGESFTTITPPLVSSSRSLAEGNSVPTDITVPFTPFASGDPKTASMVKSLPASSLTETSNTRGDTI